MMVALRAASRPGWVITNLGIMRFFIEGFVSHRYLMIVLGVDL
jgi:hypothetical protein